MSSEKIPAWTLFHGEDLTEREAVVDGERVRFLIENGALWNTCNCPRVIIPQGETIEDLHLFIFTGFIPQYGAAANVRRFDLSSRYRSNPGLNQDMRDSAAEGSLRGLFTMINSHVTATSFPYAAGGDLRFSPDISGTDFRNFFYQRVFQKVPICALGIPNGNIRVTMLVFDEHLNPEYRTIRSTPEGLFMER